MGSVTDEKEEENGDYHEFVKYCKFFTQRFIQAVVQSRLGYPLESKCQVIGDGNDWFNVHIEEFGEVTNELRKATENGYPPVIDSLCVDILLKTTDGEQLLLENWCLSFDRAAADFNVGIKSQLYHQLGTLLKSVIAASRVTPSYRYYARKQSPETFVMLYQIYAGHPTLDYLGEGKRRSRLGCLSCRFGSLTVDLNYRTNMVISSLTTSTGKERGVEREKTVLPLVCNQRAEEEEKSSRYLQEMSPVSDVQSTFSTSPVSRGDAAAWLRIHSGSGQKSSSDESSSSQKPYYNNSSSGEMGGVFRMELPARPSSSFPEHSSSSCLRLLNGAARSRNNSFPFAALLCASSVPNNAQTLVQQSGDVTVISRGDQHGPQEVETHGSPQMRPLNKLLEVEKADEEEEEEEEENRSGRSSADSFVKVSSNAFASAGDLSGDIGEFVHQCEVAPPKLRSFDMEPSSGECVTICSQLDQFKRDSSHFDQFVSALRDQLEEQSEDED